MVGAEWRLGAGGHGRLLTFLVFFVTVHLLPGNSGVHLSHIFESIS
jgi:hypothetical protein